MSATPRAMVIPRRSSAAANSLSRYVVGLSTANARAITVDPEGMLPVSVTRNAHGIRRAAMVTGVPGSPVTARLSIAHPLPGVANAASAGVPGLEPGAMLTVTASS